MFILLLTLAIATEPDPVELDALVREALADHPALSAQAAQAEAAHATTSTAGRWPEPSIQLVVATPASPGLIGDHPMAGIEATVRQPFRTLAWSRAQRNAAIADAAAVDATVDVQATQLAAELRHAWWTVAHQRARAAQIEQIVTALSEAQASALARQAATGDLAAVLRLDLLQLNLAERRDDALAAASVAASTLQGLTGSRPSDPRLPPTAEPLTAQPLTAPALQVHADQAAAHHARAEAHRTDRAPPITAWAGVRGRTFRSPTDPGTDLLILGVSVPLPTGRAATHQANAAAATHRAHATEFLHDDHRRRLTAETEALRIRHARALEHIQRLDEDQLPAARALRTLTRDRFATGRADGEALWLAERMVLELELERIDTLALLRHLAVDHHAMTLGDRR